MTQSFEGIHKDVFFILSSFEENGAFLKDMYFNFFFRFIINNTFDDEYVTELMNCNFLETIKNHTIDTNIIRQINDLSTSCLQVIFNVKLTRKCSNCETKINNSDICLKCGFECRVGVNNNHIEEFHKNKYSYPFHRRINIHNPRKYCEKWLIELQGREQVNISSDNFNKILNQAGIWFSTNTQLSCDLIRKWLKSVSLSKYNSHVTWIRKQIESAYSIKTFSYELSNYEVNKILDHFKTIIDLYPIIKREPKVLEIFKSRKIPNNLNYPYLIARILAIVICDKNRLAMLLSNIHFQSESILVKNDHIWKELCTQLHYEYLPLVYSNII